MRINPKIIVLTISGLISMLLVTAQEKYSDFNTLSRKITGLSGQYPGICKVKSLALTGGGHEIWLITAGTGDFENKPGVAVIGGVEGNQLLGCELAYGFAERLLRNSDSPDIRNLLGKITFYIIPDVSPDATEEFFSAVKYERSVNKRPFDDDKDFRTDEDPYEDLDKNGFISLVRITDPAGKYTESSDDKRIMVEADLSKGQTGGYLVYSEGIDNDKDGLFNEDGEGGVNFNRNLTYNYEEFGTSAGPYPVSEPESKAVMDFLYDKFNIYALFIFSPQDNLGQPLKSQEIKDPEQNDQSDDYRRRPGMRRNLKITSILRSDEIINKLVSERYHEITGAKGAPSAASSPGNMMDWAYFHYGRYSFSTPGWWFPVEKNENREVAFLKFAEKHKIENVFLPWTGITHPDFPGKKAETGGLKPFVMINPPADTIDYLAESHYRFITAISAMHPELEFLDVKTENTGSNLFRLSLKVHNKGIFATCTEAGDFNVWTRIMRIEITPGSEQVLFTGARSQRIQRLQGDETAEFSWLISGKGTVKIRAGAVNTGIISTSAELR
jgi:hypothetical protein